MEKDVIMYTQEDGKWVFYRNNQDHLLLEIFHTSQTNWQWFRHSLGVYSASVPAVLNSGNLEKCILYRGVDNKIYVMVKDVVECLSGSLPGNACGNPDIAENEYGKCVVYYGSDCRIYEIYKGSSNNWQWQGHCLNDIIQIPVPIASSPVVSLIDNTKTIIFRGVDDNIYEISNQSPLGWNFHVLTNQNNATGNPKIDFSKNRKSIFFIGKDKKIHEIYSDISDGWKWTTQCLSDTAGVGDPCPARNSVGCYVVFRGEDGKIYEISRGDWNGWKWICHPLSDAVGIKVKAVGNPMMAITKNSKHVVYLASDNKIYEIWHGDFTGWNWKCTVLTDCCSDLTSSPPPLSHLPQSQSQSNKWQLVWSDEFEYEGLPDETQWSYDISGNSTGWGNNEAQFYTSRRILNAKVKDSFLTITAIKEPWEGAQYTSARLTTKHDWLYGRFEVRAKLPHGRGTWPAIWMLPRDNSYGIWPKSGEIDIMEHVGHDQNKIHSTAHTETYNHTKGTQKSGQIQVPDCSQEFHVYAVEWEEGEWRAYVDDRLYFQFRKEDDKSEVWPFDRRFYLLLNVAVGGSWGGMKGIDGGIFPQKMEVDYVRVYKRHV